MSKLLTLPVTSFTSHEKLATELNRIIADEKVTGIFFNKDSLFKGHYEIYLQDDLAVSPPQVITQHVDRPSKFKDNSTSKYYCVYYEKTENKWRYKFVRKGKIYSSKRYDTELQAALAYDNHVYRVDGNTRKLNFPEKVVK